MQDFADYRNTRDLVSSKTESTDWAPDISSVIMGILIGSFVTILGFKMAEFRASQSVPIETPVVENTEEKPFVFEFYDALKVYEVLPLDER